MLKVRSITYTVNPLYAVCIGMLSVIIYLQVTGNKAQAAPAPDPAKVETQWVEKHYPEVDPKFDFQIVKDYQLEIMDENYVIMFDGDRIVGVLPLDNHCNLTNLIINDND